MELWIAEKIRMDLLKNHVNVTFKLEIISQQFTQKKEIRFEISDSFK